MHSLVRPLRADQLADKLQLERRGSVIQPAEAWGILHWRVCVVHGDAHPGNEGGVEQGAVGPSAEAVAVLLGGIAAAALNPIRVVFQADPVFLSLCRTNTFDFGPSVEVIRCTV